MEILVTVRNPLVIVFAMDFLVLKLQEEIFVLTVTYRPIKLWL